MSSFKEQVHEALVAEISQDPFTMDVIVRLKEAIMASIASPGIDEFVIMEIQPSDSITQQIPHPDEPGQMIEVTEVVYHPISDNQLTRLKMACTVFICVPVDVSPLEIIVDMKNFLL